MRFDSRAMDRANGAAKVAVLALLALSLASPALAAFDDGARYAFMASKKAQEIYVIDLQKRQRTHTLKMQTAPDSVVASETLTALVIAHIADKSLTLVDLTSKNLDQYDYPLTISPQAVVVSPIGETVAVLDRDRHKLQVHALRRKEILLNVDDVHTETELTFNPDGSTVYWADQTGGSLHAVDLWSEKKALQLARPGSGLSAMSRSIDGTLGFISNRDNGTVYVIDLRAFRLVRTNRVGKAPGRPWGTADGRFMLVPNTGSGSVTAISTVSSESLYTVDAVANPVSINPGWIDTTAAVVGSDGNIAFFNIADGSEFNRFSLDNRAEAGIVTSDSKTLAIPVPASGSLVFFDMQKRTKLSEIGDLPSDIGPASLAISNNLCH